MNKRRDQGMSNRRLVFIIGGMAAGMLGLLLVVIFVLHPTARKDAPVVSPAPVPGSDARQPLPIDDDQPTAAVRLAETGEGATAPGPKKILLHGAEYKSKNVHVKFNLKPTDPVPTGPLVPENGDPNGPMM